MTSTTATTLTDVHDMVVVHRAFRREFGLIPQLVRAVPAGDTARAAVLARHARLILEGLHLHHTSEDDILWPLLLERCPPDAELVERMEAQHSAVDGYIQQLTPALVRWETEARPAVAEEVASTFEALRAALVEHLDEEEREILPLAARHVSQEEWSRLGEAGVEKMTRQQLPLFFGAALEEADPDERREMLAVLPAPVRLLARTLFAWQYRRYVSRVRG
jgi:iron-sulfur cluster repair protein YtfE (RIC family)